MASILQLAINKLGIEFESLDLSFHQIPGRPEGDVTSYFPGLDQEDVMVCVFKGKKIHEPFHRQDFFFINYAYKQSYDALSARFGKTNAISASHTAATPCGGKATRTSPSLAC